MVEMSLSALESQEGCAVDPAPDGPAVRTYEEALAAARDGRPFSNGTEGYAWTETWCARCLHDAPFRNMGKGTGCPLIMVAMVGEKTPSEWLEQPWGEHGPPLEDRYHCIEFRGPGGGGGEPRPRPEPPDMDGLFPRPERARRMLKQPDMDVVPRLTPAAG